MKFVFLFLLFSCSKTSYLFEQGWNHLDIFYFRPIDNQKVLEDNKISEEVKNKIKLIEEYKKFFYQYFSKEETGIYTQTVFLESDVLTYLVIASNYNEIKARKFSFPFVGEFPYIGFYHLSSAQKFQKKLENEGMVTYIRKVDAYSSLGYFDDPILSTFFSYDKIELARLIFHELFHTIFFIENNVELNENMANFFSDKLTQKYFAIKESEISDRKKQHQNYLEIKKLIVQKAQELQTIYQSHPNLTKEEAQKYLKDFLEKNYLPNVRLACQKLKIKIKHCFPLKYEWNNAVFAAFMTYEKNRLQIEDLFKKMNMSLLDFYHFLHNNYEIYQKNDFDEIMSFRRFLEQKVN